MKKHKCKKSTLCICNQLASEPNEKCPVHGVMWPPRCDCGRFVAYKPKKLYLSGMTCLACGSGFYGFGYAGNKTLPCNKCGDVRPASISVSKFKAIVKRRNEGV